MRQSVYESLLKLVRAGIYDDARIVSDFPLLSEAEWGAVYQESKKQTVSGVVCHAFTFLPDSKLPPYGLLLRWVARMHRIEKEYNKMSRNIGHLTELFGQHGITPVLQKGHGVARFYPTPSLRVSGDIDLCFSEEERKAADKIIRDSGAEIHTAPDGSSCYVWRGSDVEHHVSAVKLYSLRHRKALDRIVAAHGTKEVALSPGVKARVLNPLSDLLMINVHIMKHSFGVGIGLRHFCDYALAYRSLIPEIGAEKYAEACRILGLGRWTDLLHRFINSYLASSEEGLPYTGTYQSRSALRAMHRMVTEGGNFGLYRRRTEGRKWFRKMGTFRLFLRHSSLWMRIAPAEAVGIIMRLAGGQMR